MKLDISSVLKTGGIVAAAAFVLAISATIPSLSPFFWICTCIGGFILPIGAGLLYGYIAPGEEELGESALGGLLAGGTAGVIYGLFQGVSTLVISLTEGSGIGIALGASALSSLFSVCGFGVSGFVFGAIGGIIWPFIQHRKAV